jgi:hypothetical protein
VIRTPASVVALVGLLLASTAFAQGDVVNGHVSFLFDVLPDPDPAPGRQAVTEARVRLFAERRDDIGSRLRLVLSGHAEGLLARTKTGAVTTQGAIARPLDLYADLTWPRAEVRVGASRVVWGRLDEFQPTDVVNPLDVSKFLLEGRSEARLPVGLVRGRIFLPRSTTLDVLAVPWFRTGRFDQLDEPSSPFNLAPVPPDFVERRKPSFGTASLQGGGRVTSTVARVDWGASVYRGLRSFPTVTARQAQPLLVETFPHFTMIGADFETVRGAWGVRGEAAFFADDELQSTRLVRGVQGRTLEGGIGVDRRAGSYRLAGNILFTRRTIDATDVEARSRAEPGLEGTDVLLVAAADRSFARETRTLRLFAVHNPTDGTTFARAIGAVSLRDDVWLEGSGGLVTGTGSDFIGRLSRRDFVYARLKVHF